MTFTYGANTAQIMTDNWLIQIVFVLPKTEMARFHRAMHTRHGLQVETFNIENLRVFIRKGDGVRILQEDNRYPETPSKGW